MRNPAPSLPDTRQVVVTNDSVTIDGRDIYLGKHDTPQSRERYDRTIAEWLANGRCLSTSTDRGESLTIDELILAYWG